MEDFIIEEDRVKQFIYILLTAVFAVLIFILIGQFYITGHWLLSFIFCTVLWILVQNLLLNLRKFIKKNVICIFYKNKIVYWKKNENSLNFSDIQAYKILRNYRSIKLFFKTTKTDHPSSWEYIPITYFFKRKQLDLVEKKIKEIMDKRKIKLEEV